MKLSEFILLNEKQKRFVVMNHGLLVAKRKNQQQMIFLFQMENYYVETWFRREDKAIESFLVFRDTDHLQPYLDNIPLDDLLN